MVACAAHRCTSVDRPTRHTHTPPADVSVARRLAGRRACERVPIRGGVARQCARHRLQRAHHRVGLVSAQTPAPPRVVVLPSRPTASPCHHVSCVSMPRVSFGYNRRCPRLARMLMKAPPPPSAVDSQVRDVRGRHRRRRCHGPPCDGRWPASCRLGEPLGLPQWQDPRQPAQRHPPRQLHRREPGVSIVYAVHID
jgi:hypothetical protein